jgi:hypothetical protein
VESNPIVIPTKGAIASVFEECHDGPSRIEDANCDISFATRYLIFSAPVRVHHLRGRGLKALAPILLPQWDN